MKAVYFESYGRSDVLKIGEFDTPTIERDELLIRVVASSVNPIDWKIRSGQFKRLFPVTFPSLLGFDFSGIVVKTGDAVEGFLPGDDVYGCLPKGRLGAQSEYVAAHQNVVALKPKTLSFNDAAGVPLAGMTAWQALNENRRPLPGLKILIIGASGGVGSFAVQIAKAFGWKVTAVTSGRHTDLVKSIGADIAIDYTTTHFRKTADKQDFIFDCVGQDTLSSCSGILNSDGIFVSVVPGTKTLLDWVWQKLRFWSRQKSYFVMLESRRSDLEQLSALVNQGQLKVVVDSIYPLEEIKDAHARSESHHAEGKILIQVNQS